MSKVTPATRPPDWALDRYSPAVRELVLYLCSHPAQCKLQIAIRLDRIDSADPHKPLMEWTDDDVACAWRAIRHEEKFLPPEYQHPK